MNTKKVLIPLAFYSLTFASNAQVSDVVAAKATPELPALEIQGRVFEENTAYAGTYSLIDAEAIELSSIQDVEDLSGAVPGLHVTDTNGRSFGNVYTLRASETPHSLGLLEWSSTSTTFPKEIPLV